MSGKSLHLFPLLIIVITVSPPAEGRRRVREQKRREKKKELAPPSLKPSTASIESVDLLPQVEGSSI